MTEENSNAAPRLLEGYRAVDLTDAKGQLCGRFLADLGVEVIKVEPPDGDPLRDVPPSVGQEDHKTSLVFAHLNANKKTLRLDLQSQRGREHCMQLAASADILIESAPPGRLAGWGLGYERLKEINPGLVLASITGFGQTGPRSGCAYNDLVVFAMSGLMSIAGEPAAPPCKAPETQAYYFGSLMAALGILAALYRRRRTGKGDWVDISMQEALATQEHLIRIYTGENEILRRAGSQHAHVAPGAIFPCKDGYVYLYVSRRDWNRFLEVWPDHPKEFEGPEWLNNLYRRKQAESINEAVSRYTSRHSVEELTALLQKNRIPCLPVNSPARFLEDPQVAGRRFVQSVSYPGGTGVTQPSLPVLLNGARVPLHAPVAVAFEDALGTSEEHSRPREESAEVRDGLPLQGMRVLSFDHVLAGPYGMTLLADLGAQVIKVESGKGGLDPFRFFGTGEDPNLSPRFLEFNRNKDSVTVNLKHAKGPALIKELAKKCDLVVDNFAVRVMPALGLDYEHLVEHRPDAVTLRMPGLGSTGPKKDYVTLGTNITAFTGFTFLWNHPNKVDPPTGSQTVLPDYVSGLMAAILSVAATLYRDRTGHGVAMDLAQSEAAGFMIGVGMAQAASTDTEPMPTGNYSTRCAPHGIYPCSGDDRWLALAVEDEQQWRRLAHVIGHAALLNDTRFADGTARLRHRAALDEIIASWTRERDCYAVMETLQAAQIPSGVVQNAADLAADPHLEARGFIVQQDNPRIGRITLPGPPIRFAAAATTTNWQFPELGRDNERVLKEVLGYSSEQIAELMREGVLE